MKTAFACTVLFILCACESRPGEVQACEALLLPVLKAPSTYKLIDATASKTKNGETDVFIQYDAANSYNAPIRGIFACKVDAQGVATSMQTDAEHDVEEAARTALSTDTDAEPVERSTPKPTIDLDEVPVCDRPDSPAKRTLMNEIGVDCRGE